MDRQMDGQNSRSPIGHHPSGPLPNEDHLFNAWTSRHSSILQHTTASTYFNVGRFLHDFFMKNSMDNFW